MAIPRVSRIMAELRDLRDLLLEISSEAFRARKSVEELFKVKAELEEEKKT